MGTILKLIDKWNGRNFYLYNGEKTIDVIKQGDSFVDLFGNIINVEWATFIPYQWDLCD